MLVECQDLAYFDGSCAQIMHELALRAFRYFGSDFQLKQEHSIDEISP